MQLDEVIRISLNMSSFPQEHKKYNSTRSTFISVVFHGKEPPMKALLKDIKTMSSSFYTYIYIYI